jgi:chromosomal replication initiator protein
MEAIWNEVKNAIKKQIPIHSFRMWIEPMEFIECKECSISLSCPNNFSKRKILDHYAELITSEINRETEKAYKLSI